MSRIAIPVALLEFDEGGNTIWVHNDKGATVLRIKVLDGKLIAQRDCTNICSHLDVVVNGGDVTICVADDVVDPATWSPRHERV